MRYAAFGLALSMLVAFASCTSASDGTQSAPRAADGGASDASNNGGGGGGGTASFQVLSISDWHGQLDPVTEKDAQGNDVGYGGLAVLSAYFAKERAKNPSTLLFTAGDQTGATPALSSFFEDRPAIDALNYLQLTATTFGNHDFDRGPLALKDRVQDAKFTFVTTNMGRVSEVLGPKPVEGFYIVEVGSAEPKVRVAVLGITNPDAPTMVYPGRMGGMTVNDPVEPTIRAASAARAAGADVVIALAHLGATGVDGSGAPVGPLADFAKAISGVDVVLGDHTNQIVNARVGKVLVVENRSRGRTYARLALDVDRGQLVSAKAEIVEPLASAIKPDPGADALLAPYRTQLSARLDDKVAVVPQALVQDGVSERKAEVPLGDVVADAMLLRYRTEGAQLAFTNAGGLRAGLPSSYKPIDTALRRPDQGYAAGPPYDVVAGDVLSVLPFGNVCVVRTITGQQLWAVLEHGVAAIPAADGRFLQIAGFKFVYSAGAAAGSRVQSVTLDEGAKAIGSTDASTYTIVTNDFTSAGGDGYTILAQGPAVVPRDLLADVVTDYLRAQSPLAVPPTTRITKLP